jgi:hypothetical protein
MRIRIRFITLMLVRIRIRIRPINLMRIRIRNTACQQASVPVLPAWAAEAGQSHLWGLPHAEFLTE